MPLMDEFDLLAQVIPALTEARDELRKSTPGTADRFRASLFSEALQHLERAALPTPQMLAIRLDDLPPVHIPTGGWVLVNHDKRGGSTYHLVTDNLNAFVEGGPRKGWRWSSQRPPAFGDRKWQTRRGSSLMLDDAYRAAESAYLLPDDEACHRCGAVAVLGLLQTVDSERDPARSMYCESCAPIWSKWLGGDYSDFTDQTGITDADIPF